MGLRNVITLIVTMPPSLSRAQFGASSLFNRPRGKCIDVFEGNTYVTKANGMSVSSQRKMLEGESATDLSARRRAGRERLLVARVAELTAALENLSQGVCHFDADWRLVTANDRYAEIYRLPKGALRPGMTLKQIVEMRDDIGASPTDVATYLERCRAVLDGSAPALWTAPLRSKYVATSVGEAPMSSRIS